MDSKDRFSARVDDYVKYRPTYPRELLDFLQREIGLTPTWRIADVGSGTGISTKLFLDHGNEVFAVEPNAPMRQAAEKLLGQNPKFRSINGAADATTLPPASVDLVVAAQAFHWFDPETARTEFLRILKPGGHVLLMWNNRALSLTPFLHAYEQLLVDFGTDYHIVRHNIVHEKITRLFGINGFKETDFANSQRFDFDGAKGRLLSSSYAPPPGHPNHAPMLARLREIFDANQSDGQVEFLYRTELYFGQL